MQQKMHQNPDFVASQVESYAAEASQGFATLYGGAEATVEGGEGLNMGIILLAQGALEEAVYVLELFAKLAQETLGEEHAASRKAERFASLARREKQEELEEGDHVKRMKYGCNTVRRAMEELGKA
ncbi:MAG: hypothetical protein M1837_004810 [Sclerophora amabilis]|nr:MAG: hypothetical protein M1837_004810 [Sclerophora amabilis]